MEDELWDEVLNMLNTSKKRVYIYKGIENVGSVEIENMGICSNSVLGVIVLFTSGICIDNWIRVIGQKCNAHNGICAYNSKQMNGDSGLLSGMLVVAQDVVGGIFAINISRFNEGYKKVWYFAPDTLGWECLNMNYAEYIAWLAQGNTDEFYDNMRWKDWKKDCENIDFDKGYLIYPFLWSRECDLRIATKKIVPYIELNSINFDYAQKIFS